MKQRIDFNTQKTQAEFQEGSRNYYQKPLNMAWQALKTGKSITLLGEFSDTGWVLLFVEIDGTEHQLTKKQVRSSDLKYMFY